MSFQIFYQPQERKPSMIESDRGGEFYNKIFKIFLKHKIFIIILVILIKVLQ